MKRRLYFLLPSVEVTARAHDELLLARIEERNIHVMAREGTDLGDLPQADLLQSSDILHGTEMGLFIGGLTGALAGLAVMYFPPAGFEVGLWVVLGCALVGAVFGAWVSALIGTDVPNTQLARFVPAMNDGDILIMVDVPKDRVDEISAIIKKHHPEADMQGTEPTIPAFP